MKVKLLVSRSGVDGAFNRGDVIEVGEAEGERMIAAEQAERVEAAKPKTERATAATKPETRG